MSQFAAENNSFSSASLGFAGSENLGLTGAADEWSANKIGITNQTSLMSSHCDKQQPLNAPNMIPDPIDAKSQQIPISPPHIEENQSPLQEA